MAMAAIGRHLSETDLIRMTENDLLEDFRMRISGKLCLNSRTRINPGDLGYRPFAANNADGHRYQKRWQKTLKMVGDVGLEPTTR